MAQDLKEFIFLNLAGNIMAHGGAEDLPFHRGQALNPIFHQGLADGGEGVSIVKDEGTQIMAVPANLQRFGQRHGFGNGSFPELPGSFTTV